MASLAPAARGRRAAVPVSYLIAAAIVGAPAPAEAAIDGSPRTSRLTASFAVPVTAVDVRISYAECPDAPGEGAACADVAGGVIYLAGAWDRFTVAHELGHFYLERDLAELADAGYWRDALMVQLGFDPLIQSWDGGTGEDCVGRPCPSELAADAYATCALRMTPAPRRRGRAVVGGWETAYGYEPTRRQHRRVCRVLRSSGATHA